MFKSMYLKIAIKKNYQKNAKPTFDFVELIKIKFCFN